MKYGLHIHLLNYEAVNQPVNWPSTPEVIWRRSWRIGLGSSSSSGKGGKSGHADNSRAGYGEPTYCFGAGGGGGASGFPGDDGGPGMIIIECSA